MNIVAVDKFLFETQSKSVPDIRPGDTITVSEKIVDGKKSRIQKFQGIVMKISGSLLKKQVLLRKKFQDFWIEKHFFLHSPLVEEIVVDSQGKARRSSLYYLRKKKNLAKKLKRLKK